MSTTGSPEEPRNIGIAKVRFNYESRSWESQIFDLPYFVDDFVILTPKDILTKDDTWINRPDMVGDFDQIVASLPNDQLRGQLSSFFLRNMPANPKQGDRDRVIWGAVREYPEFIDYYIRYKEDNGDKAKDVSKEKVEETENLFIRNVNELINLGSSGVAVSTSKCRSTPRTEPAIAIEIKC